MARRQVRLPTPRTMRTAQGFAGPSFSTSLYRTYHNGRSRGHHNVGANGHAVPVDCRAIGPVKCRPKRWTVGYRVDSADRSRAMMECAASSAVSEPETRDAQTLAPAAAPVAVRL